MKVYIILIAAKSATKNYEERVSREDSMEDIQESFGQDSHYHYEHDEYLTEQEIEEMHDYIYGINIEEICKDQ